MTKQTAHPTPAYEAVMNASFNKAQECATKRRELDTQVRALLDQEKEHLRDIKKLNRIAYLVGCGYSIGEWYEDSNRVAAMLKFYTLRLSGYEFTAYVKERKDLKMLKYEVHVSGEKTTLEGNPHDIHGNYRDFDYVKNKYKDADMPLVKGFKTMEDAADYAAKWMLNLQVDHEAVIEEEQKLVRLMKSSGFTYDKDRKWYTKYY